MAGVALTNAARSHGLVARAADDGCWRCTHLIAHMFLMPLDSQLVALRLIPPPAIHSAGNAGFLVASSSVGGSLL